MTDDRLITVAIHTYQKATILKSILENEGIEVALHNVNLVQPVVSSGVRVRIHESDLPKALRIIENTDIFADEMATQKAPKTMERPSVLVPVDFAEPRSMQACEAAFGFAAMHDADIVLLHSFISPSINTNFQMTDPVDNEYDDVDEEAEMRQSIEDAAEHQMRRFAEKLRMKMSQGELPRVNFTTRVVDDVAEDAINSVAREMRPMAIVMATRPAESKEREMVGSVSAEVLDTCRFPVIILPEGTVKSAESTDKSHVLFFWNYEQNDLLALDLLYRLFPKCHFHVTLMNVPTKKNPIDIDEIGEGLEEYCREHMPRFSFTIRCATLNDMEALFEQIDSDHHIDFLAVPNKKRNIFTRLFNPGLAHRLLLHSNIPLTVLPV